MTNVYIKKNSVILEQKVYVSTHDSIARTSLWIMMRRVRVIVGAMLAVVLHAEGAHGQEQEQEQEQVNTARGAHVQVVTDVDIAALEAEATRITKLLRAAGKHVDDVPTDGTVRRNDDQSYERSERIQRALDSYCLLTISIDDEGWLRIESAHPDPTRRLMRVNEWETFVIKVINRSYVQTPLEIDVLEATGSGVVDGSATGAVDLKASSAHQWVDMRVLDDVEGSARRLNGGRVEYRVIQMRPTQSGYRSGSFVARLGGGQVSRGHYAVANILFRVLPQ